MGIKITMGRISESLVNHWSTAGTAFQFGLRRCRYKFVPVGFIYGVEMHGTSSRISRSKTSHSGVQGNNFEGEISKH